MSQKLDKEMIIVLMGVCGSGKTTVGQALAGKLKWSFVDADEFHSDENKQKMSSGQPLTDQDRLPWLQNIHSYIRCKLTEGLSAVVTCSALKKQYRQILLYGDNRPPDTSSETHDSVSKSCDKQASHDQISHGQETGSCSSTKGDNDSAKCLEQSSKHLELSLFPFIPQEYDSKTKHDLHKQEVEGLKDGSLVSIEKNDINLQISDTEPASPRCYTDEIIFVLLSGSYSTLEKRLSCRQDHFMPGSLLRSQLETLETPGIDENCIIVDVDGSVEEIVSKIITQLELKSN